MRKIAYLTLTAMLILAATGCREGSKTADGRCHIYGTIDEKYNDKRIFLVPLTGPATAATVDSIEVKDGKFEFHPDTLMMAKILMDYHYRLGIQPLLVVVEPGEVKVSIDSISHASGTPLNDSLEHWKVITEQHNQQMMLMRKTIKGLELQGDSLRAKAVKERSDSFHLAYKQLTRRMAKNMEGSMLGGFLKELYPLTYKRSYPNGRVVTMNADTNEEIAE
ncbi:MAG: DUF4369 domain-containing protein [Prevotella sp.]|nr:DUF4369 domain-containing protein [Prevotella sp.]